VLKIRARFTAQDQLAIKYLMYRLLRCSLKFKSNIVMIGNKDSQKITGVFWWYYDRRLKL